MRTTENYSLIVRENNRLDTVAVTLPRRKVSTRNKKLSGKAKEETQENRGNLENIHVKKRDRGTSTHTQRKKKR